MSSYLQTQISSMDGSQWITQIRNTLNDTSKEVELHISPSIICVPKPLLSTKPEAYIPQLIALGPYHHNKEELHRIERYKICAVKTLKSQLADIDFESILDTFLKLEYQIRAHYQSYLPFDGETLAWMMAIDASFLLDFMNSFTSNDNNNLARIPSKNVKFLDPTRRTSTHDMLIRDVVMLENQIPIFLLLKILESKSKSPKIIVEKALAEIVIALLSELTPFKMATQYESIEIAHHSHLLELLYQSIVPLYDDDEPQEVAEDVNHKSRLNKCGSLFHMCKEFTLARGRALASLLLNFCIKIPTFSFIKLAVENMCVIQTDTNKNQECTHSPNQGISFEEISIPSVTELAKAGVQFKPTNGDISSVAFDAKTGTLYLPEINLNVNSDTVLRNIVAYEAAIVTGPLTFTRYIELMNGIIDTEEDARILREKEILVNRLRNDKEVAEMWNGMSRSIRLTRVRCLDEMIEEINKYYNGKWKVKIGRFVRKYVLRSWEYMVVIIVILVLAVVGIHVLSAGYGLLRSWTYKGAFRGKGK